MSTISYSRYIRIQREKDEAIYLQIVYQFIQAIQRGFLPYGMKLAGSRVIADELAVHRKTVMMALNDLQAQGWIYTIAKKGTFVSNPNKINAVSNQEITRKQAGFSFRKSFLLDSPFEKHESTYYFNDGEPDYRLINLDELTRFYRLSFKRKQVLSRMRTSLYLEDHVFLEKLSYYFNITRSIQISPQNITTAQNREVLLFAVAQQLIQPEDVVLVGALSYFSVNMIFQQSGALIKTIPVDDDGLDTDFIRANFSKDEIRCLYLNSQNFYPTTATLSLQRRKELLQLAEEYNFVIIEDNDDFEFHYAKTSLPSLFSLDESNRVLYVSTFGKYLPPSFQIGFLLSPSDFSLEMKKLIRVMEPQKDFVLEQVLSEMIDGGDSIRYLKKASKSYKEKRDEFLILMMNQLSDYCEITIPSGGLAFWIVFKQMFSLNQLIKICKENDLFIPRICMYQNNTICALRLGFGHLNKEEMKEIITILHRSIKQVIVLQSN